jgi:hypothetical protein
VYETTLTTHDNCTDAGWQDRFRSTAIDDVLSLLLLLLLLSLLLQQC